MAAAPTSSRSRGRRGVALLEVLIALVMLAFSGTAMITLLGQTAHTLRNLRDSERTIRLASEELERVVLWDRGRLAEHVGHSTIRGWSIRIEEFTPVLFDVSIAESDTGIVLLRTTAYRPEDQHAARP